MNLTGILFFEDETIINCDININISYNNVNFPSYNGRPPIRSHTVRDITLNIKTISNIFDTYLRKKVHAKFCIANIVHFEFFGLILTSCEYSSEYNNIFDIEACADHYKEVSYIDPVLKNILRANKLKRILG